MYITFTSLLPIQHISVLFVYFPDILTCVIGIHVRYKMHFLVNRLEYNIRYRESSIVSRYRVMKPYRAETSMLLLCRWRLNLLLAAFSNDSDKKVSWRLRPIICRSSCILVYSVSSVVDLRYSVRVSDQKCSAISVATLELYLQPIKSPITEYY